MRQEIEHEAPAPLCWTLAQAAARLNVSKITVRRLLARGLIKRISGVRRVLISEAELLRFSQN